MRSSIRVIMLKPSDIKGPPVLSESIKSRHETRSSIIASMSRFERLISQHLSWSKNRIFVLRLPRTALEPDGHFDEEAKKALTGPERVL